MSCFNTHNKNKRKNNGLKYIYIYIYIYHVSDYFLEHLIKPTSDCEI